MRHIADVNAYGGNCLINDRTLRTDARVYGSPLRVGEVTRP